MEKGAIKAGANWIYNRLKEPSTYAGIGVAALAVAEVAKDAQGVASIFKEQGTTAGLLALVAAVAAIAKHEKPKDETVIDNETGKSVNGN